MGHKFIPKFLGICNLGICVKRTVFHDDLLCDGCSIPFHGKSPYGLDTPVFALVERRCNHQGRFAWVDGANLRILPMIIMEVLPVTGAILGKSQNLSIVPSVQNVAHVISYWFARAANYPTARQTKQIEQVD